MRYKDFQTLAASQVLPSVRGNRANCPTLIPGRNAICTLCLDACGETMEVMEDFAPAVDAVGVGGAQGDAQPGVLLGDGRAVASTAEDIGSGGKAREDSRWWVVVS
jgi:hypothetical protein